MKPPCNHEGSPVEAEIHFHFSGSDGGGGGDDGDLGTGKNIGCLLKEVGEGASGPRMALSHKCPELHQNNFAPVDEAVLSLLALVNLGTEHIFVAAVLLLLRQFDCLLQNCFV